MELKEQKEKSIRPIEAKDLKTVEIALIGALLVYHTLFPWQAYLNG